MSVPRSFRLRTAAGRRVWVAVAVVAVFGIVAAAAGVVLRPGSLLPCSPERPQSLGERAHTERKARSPEELGIRPVSAWESTLREQWERDRQTATAWSTSGNSWSHYRLSFFVDALNAAYLATGDPAYVDQALRLTENVVATAAPSASLPGGGYDDGYYGWVSQRMETAGQEVPLYESFYWRYATSTLRVMHDTGASKHPAFRERYARLVDFAEDHVFGKWYERGPEANIYRSHTHMASHWALIAMNLAEVTDDPSKRRTYRRVVHAINHGLPNYGSSLHEQMTANPMDGRAYHWDDEFESYCRPGSDVSHGNGVVAYVVEAESQGYGWDETDTRRLVLTFAEAVWPRGGSPAAYVDGSGEGSGWFSDGFVKLGRYDAALQRRLESHQPANMQFTANAALNAAMLLGEGPARSASGGSG